MAQLRQFGEHLDLLLVEALILAVLALLGQRIAQMLFACDVETPLLAFELRIHYRFELVGQIGKHVLLEPAQHERADECLQPARGIFVAAHDGQLEALAEAHVGTQEARHEEIEDAP